MKDYPEWTVERCTCSSGNPDSACPYSQPQDEDFMIKGIYSRYEAEKSAKDTPRPNRYLT